jgi:NitT/TauT family transport system substrate-binding protein
LTEARFDRWRDFDPEDTVRFYALRMNELGLLKVTTNEIAAKGTNWHFVDELRLEMKG